jgi:putative membrane protein
MWKRLFRILKSLLFSVLIYGIFLFVLHQYTDWFWIEATEYDVFLTFILLAILFWIVNNIVKAVLKFLSLPLTYLTFWSSVLVLNVILMYVFEYLVNGSGLWITVKIWNFIQVVLMSLVASFIAFLIKKIKL